LATKPETTLLSAARHASSSFSQVAIKKAEVAVVGVGKA
jgi:hypothetical protein